MKINHIKIIGIISIVIGIIKYGNEFLYFLKNIPNFYSLFNNEIVVLGMIYFLLYVFSGYGLLRLKKYGWYLMFFNYIFLFIRILEANVITLIFAIITGFYDASNYINFFTQIDIIVISIVGILSLFYLTKKGVRKKLYIEVKLPLIIGINVILSIVFLLFRDLTVIIELLKTII